MDGGSDGNEAGGGGAGEGGSQAADGPVTAYERRKARLAVVARLIEAPGASSVVADAITARLRGRLA